MKSLPFTAILVADHLHRAVEGARVTAGGSSVYTDARGRAALQIPPEVPLGSRHLLVSGTGKGGLYGCDAISFRANP